MLERMSKNDDNRHMTRGARLRRGALIGSTIIGVGVATPITVHAVRSAVHHIAVNRLHNDYVEHPERIPAGQYDVYTVRDGDEALTIANHYSGDVDPGEMSTEIQHQTDKNGDLHPGQTVRIEKRLVHAPLDARLVDPADVTGGR